MRKYTPEKIPEKKSEQIDFRFPWKKKKKKSLQKISISFPNTRVKLGSTLRVRLDINFR